MDLYCLFLSHAEVSSRIQQLCNTGELISIRDSVFSNFKYEGISGGIVFSRFRETNIEVISCLFNNVQTNRQGACLSFINHGSYFISMNTFSDCFAASGGHTICASTRTLGVRNITHNGIIDCPRDKVRSPFIILSFGMGHNAVHNNASQSNVLMYSMVTISSSEDMQFSYWNFADMRSDLALKINGRSSLVPVNIDHVNFIRIHPAAPKMPLLFFPVEGSGVFDCVLIDCHLHNITNEDCDVRNLKVYNCTFEYKTQVEQLDTEPQINEVLLHNIFDKDEVLREEHTGYITPQIKKLGTYPVPIFDEPADEIYDEYLFGDDYEDAV